MEGKLFFYQPWMPAFTWVHVWCMITCPHWLVPGMQGEEMVCVFNMGSINGIDSYLRPSEMSVPRDTERLSCNFQSSNFFSFKIFMGPVAFLGLGILKWAISWLTMH